jgi:large subunit ribosomal protein L9
MFQIYQPTEEVKQEDVVLVTESKEDLMKEYERAALILDKAKLVSSLLFKAFQACLIETISMVLFWELFSS